ncbi:hypothetical protein [Frigoribacterium sp. Leaf44]|uniref:hypothetical protein n=1 Tax=Frigoribacterium sp. Leaf44 TaxID=1736220 RepID=UPI0006FD87C0|nr:hypothetical protein [Frigoribacterium sp. Leaf44]KQN41657.1 hypothetical protein ASE87_12685 [Frigoribacterium sp. Leaf44]
MSDREFVVDPFTQTEVRVPSGIWQEQAIEHARRSRNGELRRIRFFLDWGHRYPLWEDGSDGYTKEPGDYGLSADLGERLHAWYQTWAQHCSPEHGWSDEQRHQAWLVAGHRLANEVELEVYDFAEVIREFDR